MRSALGIACACVLSMFAGVDTSYAVEYRGRLLEALSPLRVVANEGEDCSVTVGVRVRPFSERLDRPPYV